MPGWTQYTQYTWIISVWHFSFCVNLEKKFKEINIAELLHTINRAEQLSRRAGSKSRGETINFYDLYIISRG